MRSHPMKAFGGLPDEIEKIRVDRLEDRRSPKVPFPHKHDFFHILVIEKGKGWHDIDFVRYPVESGAVFIMKPHQVHSWSLSGNTTGFVIEFEDHMLAETLSAGFLPDYYKSGTKELKRLQEICSMLRTEIQNKEKEWQKIVSFQLGTLLSLFWRHSDSVLEPGEKNNVVQDFNRLLGKYFKEKHNVDFYAKKIGLSSKALSMRITRSTGLAPKDLIQARCLLEAQRMLAYSELSVNEIAWSLGFEDANYFGRLFRSKVGTSPGAFRTKTRTQVKN